MGPCPDLNRQVLGKSGPEVNGLADMPLKRNRKRPHERVAFPLPLRDDQARQMRRFGGRNGDLARLSVERTRMTEGEEGAVIKHATELLHALVDRVPPRHLEGATRDHPLAVLRKDRGLRVSPARLLEEPEDTRASTDEDDPIELRDREAGLLDRALEHLEDMRNSLRCDRLESRAREPEVRELPVRECQKWNIQRVEAVLPGTERNLRALDRTEDRAPQLRRNVLDGRDVAFGCTRFGGETLVDRGVDPIARDATPFAREFVDHRSEATRAPDPKDRDIECARAPVDDRNAFRSTELVEDAKIRRRRFADDPQRLDTRRAGGVEQPDARLGVEANGNLEDGGSQFRELLPARLARQQLEVVAQDLLGGQCPSASRDERQVRGECRLEGGRDAPSVTEFRIRAREECERLFAELDFVRELVLRDGRRDGARANSRQAPCLPFDRRISRSKIDAVGLRHFLLPF